MGVMNDSHAWDGNEDSNVVLRYQIEAHEIVGGGASIDLMDMELMARWRNLNVTQVSAGLTT